MFKYMQVPTTGLAAQKWTGQVAGVIEEVFVSLKNLSLLINM